MPKLRRQKAKPNHPDLLVDLGTVLSSEINGNRSMLAEIDRLVSTIISTRKEISTLLENDINVLHIPSATDELDAISLHTAEATEVILDTCEVLDALATEGSPIPVEAVRLATSKIYEACSFQDITGQRIGKVVSTLKLIEDSLVQMAHARPSDGQGGNPVHARDSLLNGPQLPHSAMSQFSIDRILDDGGK